MARNEQLIRQHKLLEILERHRFGCSLEDLRDTVVEELGLTGLHVRSVRRDLQALQAAGFDLDVHALQRGKVWKLGPRARQAHRITATATELAALSLGRDLLVPLAGTPFWQGIESFWNKIREVLPDGVWKHFTQYRKLFYVMGTTAKSYESKRGILETLQRASRQHRVVDVEYEAVGKPRRPRRIEPLAFVFYASSLYVIAMDHDLPEDSDRIRHWKLDRFHRARTTDTYFSIPEDFDLESYLGQSVGIFSRVRPARKYRILVQAPAAAWVTEDPWHPEQTSRRRRDGSVEITVPATHDMEIIPRVLALGAQAEVLAPASCRTAMAALTREMADRYVANMR